MMGLMQESQWENEDDDDNDMGTDDSFRQMKRRTSGVRRRYSKGG